MMGGQRGHGQEIDHQDCAEIETWRSTAASFGQRLEQIEHLTQSMHEHLMAHIAQEAKTQSAIIELIETWNGARFTVRLVKWIAPIIAACGVFYAWARDHIR